MAELVCLFVIMIFFPSSFSLSLPLSLSKYLRPFTNANSTIIKIIQIGIRTYEYWKFPCGSMSAFCSTIVAEASGLLKLGGAAVATAQIMANTTRNFILYAISFYLLALVSC